MNFRRRRHHSTDDIAVDFIPLIDILLVVLIFITATTTFSRVQEIPVNLPSSSSQNLSTESHVLAISQDGQYALDGRFLSQSDNSVAEALLALQDKTALLIYADANARHSSVIHALEAARSAQFEKISFATQE
ncbi:MAG TPA: biopolymer transporter ExbD [Paenalcaligenes hominis]|uniref:Biopolymer transporter ExbD n=1 Tax=Paenalcaligenes hominis TaxID=643674 RepID=A0A9D2VFC8_9BURK|nr:biopolymer transporter ExbD [Paenalcaligenes hominis]